MKVKIHHSYRDIVAICDSNLIGKRFEEGIMQIEIKEHFFDGEEMSPEQVSELMKDGKLEDSTFTIVGEESIKMALKENLIAEEGIIRIDKVPIALVLL